MVLEQIMILEDDKTMIASISKWTIIIIVLLTIFLILYFTGRKSVHSELLIEATPQKVWKVLMDEKNYPSWNTVLAPTRGEIKQGNILEYTLFSPNGKTILVEMKVEQLKTDKLLNQYGGTLGIFTYDHRYILKHQGKNTKLIIHEDFKGIAVHFMNLDWIQPAYSRLTESLRLHILESSEIPQ